MAELTVLKSMSESTANTLSFKTSFPKLPKRSICFVNSSTCYLSLFRFILIYNDRFCWTQVCADTTSGAGCHIKDLGLAVCAWFKDAKGANANADKPRTRRTFCV